MKKVIVAPLNWGLGHASRCVIIIKALLEHGFTPILAGDGDALLLLKKEFPELESIQLPSYSIRYTRNLKWHLLLQIPRILRVMKEERTLVERYVLTHRDVVGIISDNRFGVRSTQIPSVYMTHQINVLSGFWTPLTSFVHQRIIKRYDECWIPDDEHASLAGKLSTSGKKLAQKYIGVLSRSSKEEKELKYNVAVILSGPEPHRSKLEDKLLSSLEKYEGKTLFVRGMMEPNQEKRSVGNMTIYNYMLWEELQEVLNTTEVIISRSGYSSIMDYAVTGKKAILIPTEGQTEQEYLAKYLTENKNIISVKEDDFKMEDIEEARNLNGLKAKKTILPKELFRLFERK